MQGATAMAAPRPFNIMDIKVGPLPLPVYAALAAIIFLTAYIGKLPADMVGGFAICMAMGVLLGDIGLRVPVLREIGGPAILSIFIPSIMVYYNLLNPSSINAIKALTKTSNFLYFYIACLVTGSMLGMVRMVLIQGFLRMFVPLFFGTVACCVVGAGVGVVTGIGLHDAFFFVVVPIISGGVGEGILPLAAGYSEITSKAPDSFIALLAPAAMIGNITAIMLAGMLRKLGESRPHLSGNGRLVKTGDESFMNAKNAEEPLDIHLMGCGMLMACGFYLFGILLNKFIPIPAPILMILSAALVKVLGIMPEKMERGAHQWYMFVSKNLTWALLVGVGVLYTPWKDVIAVVSPAYILTAVSTVLAMVASGFFIARFMNMYPIESAIVTACHSGLGGTGDVAILSSANRMELMPFAQISTRIGGACVVVAAIVIMRMANG